MCSSHSVRSGQQQSLSDSSHFVEAAVKEAVSLESESGAAAAAKTEDVGGAGFGGGAY